MKKTKFKQTEFGLLPEEWNLGVLKDNSLNLFSGGTPNTNIGEYWGGRNNWLQSGETGNRFIKKTEKTITDLGVEKSSTRLAKVGDVLLASAGQGYTRGQVAYCLIDTFINQSIVSIRPNPKALDSKFLFYNLQFRYDELRSISDAHSSRGSLTTTLLNDLMVPLPIVAEQQAIASILSSFDDKIELLEKQNETLEKIGEALFKHWFVDFEFPDENDKPYKSSGGKMIWSEELQKEIPIEWGVSTIREKLVTILGGTPSRDVPNYWGGNIPWINSGAINDFPIVSASEYISEVGLKNSAARLMPKGTVVLPFVISPGKEVNISVLTIESSGNQSVLGILQNKHVSSGFIYYWVQLKKEKIYSSATGGAQQHINKKNVDDLEILIPFDDTLNRFNFIVNNIFDKIYLNSKQILSLKQTRDLLLPKLMSGKIRVGQ